MQQRLTNFADHMAKLTAAFHLLLSLVLAPAGHAEPVRVTTWNLHSSAASQSEKAIHDDAAVLRRLNADVIVLQNVPDWQTCDALVKALRPTNYYLVVCSSFRDARTGALSRQQSAILSKVKASISWSEQWKGEGGVAAAPGGFAFAAIRMGNKNAGVFSVQIGDAGAGTPQVESIWQLLRQVTALRQWTANRVDGLVAAGDFNFAMGEAAAVESLRLLSDTGFANVFASMPLDERVTVPGNGKQAGETRDYIFSRNARLAGGPNIFVTTWTEHYPVTCQLDLNAPQPVPAPAPVVTKVAAPVVDVKPPAEKPVATPAPEAKVVPPVAQLRPPEAKTNLISAPETKPAPSPPAPLLAEKTVAMPTNRYDADWLLEGLSMGMLLVLLVWRLMRRSATAARRSKAVASISLPGDAERIIITHGPAQTTGSAARQPIIHIESADSSQTQTQAWQRRAEEAERRAEQANAVMRAGLMPLLSQWLKGKLVRKLVSDRAQLMEVQQTAALKLMVVDERLSKIESQLQQRDRDYERRIDDLMNELAVAKEENRELIRARIAQVRAEMERERGIKAERETLN